MSMNADLVLVLTTSRNMSGDIPVVLLCASAPSITMFKDRDDPAFSANEAASKAINLLTRPASNVMADLMSGYCACPMATVKGGCGAVLVMTTLWAPHFLAAFF